MSATDGPDCPGCKAPLGTPIAEAEVERWDGPGDANLFCPACGTGWVGSVADVTRAVAAWLSYEASL